MLSGADEGPVYYREIQKNAFLKRIPSDAPTGKLRPLATKKPPLKPMWTLFCVHNGRTPFLEQYPEPDSPATLSHRPAWRACLRSARHVTASVKPHAGDEYDFLVDTDHGPVRMLAPDWDSMQDWVSILRSKLHELRIVSRGENVYGAPPVAPAPRAAARDPTSPLPPTPPVPPDRVPGIDLTSITRPTIETTQAETTATTATTSETTSTTANNNPNTTSTTNLNATTNVTFTSTTNTTNSVSLTPINTSVTTLNNDVNLTMTTNATSNLTDLTTANTNLTNTNVVNTNLTQFSTNLTSLTNATTNSTSLTDTTTNLLPFSTTLTNATANLTSFTNVNTNLTPFSTNLTSLTNANTNLTPFSTNLTSLTNATTNLTCLTNATTNLTSLTNATTNLTSLTSLTNATTSLSEQQLSSEVDISNWEPFSQPSTSRDTEPKQSVAKICGQNICLDDSILKRNVTDSDEEFFAEIDKIHDSAENLNEFGYTQRVRVNDGSESKTSDSAPQRTNITVIQVSNKEPPHTAIPVLGPETDVFDFEFKQKLSINPEKSDFINIVNTENRYGTVFEKPPQDGDYGHISLTTTVSLTGVKDNDVYERLCMASTSNKASSPLPLRNVKCMEKMRKSSLPNLEVESDYEYLFPSQNRNDGNNGRNEVPNGRNGRMLSSNNRDVLPNSSNNRTILTSSREMLPVSRNVQTNLTNSRDVPNGRSNQSNLPSSREILPNGRSGLPNLPNGRNDVIINEAPRSNVNIESIRTLRSNVERSQSQNAYDIGPRQRQNDVRRVPNNSPKREAKIEKSDPTPKPIWKRGLTELSLLSRLRGIGQAKRQESPTRHENEDRGVTSPVKVVHRSRPAGRVDSTRRRSNSLTNSQSPPIPQNPSLQPLRARQAAALRAEQRRGACVATTVPVRDPPLLVDYERQVWVARWGMGGTRGGGRAGDRVSALAGAQPCSATHARHLLKTAHSPIVDILFHRVPLGKIYVINKNDQENLGIKLDNECTIVSVAGDSPAGKAGLPPPGRWSVTEVNNRPINLIKGGEEEMNRIAMLGSEVSVLIQPAALVKKIRSAVKGSKPLLAIR